MNDDTDKPLNPVGDAALEARITAWVLGEASPFEAAELEEICARDPEARLFERRLRVLHGFITADRKVGADEEWKLPAEKRAKIEALFEKPVAEKEEVAEQPKIVHRRSHSGRRVLLALAACTVVSVATWSLMDTVVMSQKKSEVAAMRMESPRATVDFLPGGGAGGGGGFGGGVGAGSREDIVLPASPVARSRSAPAKPMGEPSPTPDAAPLPPLVAAKKSEHGQVADESLATRSKSDASGVPVKKPLASYMHLSQNAPFTTKPQEPAGEAMPLAEAASAAPAEPTATGAIAFNDAVDRESVGVDAPVDLDAKPANIGGVESMERAPVDKSLADVSDGQVRSRSEAPAADGKKDFAGWLQSSADSAAPASGPVAGDRVMEPGLASGGADAFGSAAPAQFKGGKITGGTAVDLSELATAGNRSGAGAINRNSIDAILNNPDHGSPSGVVGTYGYTGVDFDVASGKQSVPQQPEFKDLAKMGEMAGAAGEKQKFDMNLRLGAERSAFAKDAAGNGANWFSEGEETKSLAESKNKGASAEGNALHDFDGFVNYGSPIEGVPADGGYSGLAQKEMIRRQNAVATSDKLRDEGREAYAKGDYKAAVDKYKASMDVLPEAEMVQDRRDYLSQVLADGSTALGEDYRRKGKYDEARQLAEDALEVDADNEQAKTLKSYLDDPIRTNPALSFQNEQNTDEVRRKLYLAEGNYNLGKFDEANRTYEDVLRIDPYNKAARRGMETVAQARSDYYRAAYDQTRAQLLAEVDRAWEVPVPPVEAQKLNELRELAGNTPDTEAKGADWSGLTREMREGALNQFGSLLEGARDAYAKEDFTQAYRKYVQALERLPDEPAMKERRDFVQLSLRDASEALASVASKLGDQDLSNKWMENSRKWEPKPEPEEQPVLDPKAETLTSAEPFSTFSLHVSDASFKMAKAALDRGEVPAAEGIRPEEFYNAFDYGDPSPANGEPVVCAVEQSAHPALPQRNLLRIGVKTGSQGRGGSTPLNLTLLLDSSGSMEREDRNAGLANAVQQLSGLLKEGDTVSVIGFARQPRLLVDRLPGNRAQELNAIFAQTPSEGGTNLEEGIKLGEELALRQFNPAAQNRIVLFTDGAANLGDAKPETLQAKVEEMRQKGIAFDAAGFGTDGLNDKLLEQLTRNGNGRYYIVDRAEDADANFAKQLAGAFRPAAENVKVQVRFNPARVAKYKLIGFEEHRLKKEDFRNDSVDAAEMAAEEAGNALYQIEALPQGEGEVGEVSVRFRDAASGQMVERTWTIPYEAQAPAFDQAAPSIQLAGLAAFAAEKLRSAPLAEAVDFQQLAPVMAKVKARYASSKPVAELEAMIGKLK